MLGPELVPHDERRDPPRIERWNAIGSARVGMTRADVEAVYGRPARARSLDQLIPATSAYEGKRVVGATYRVPAGTLEVTYLEGRVAVIATTSPRYRTSDGVRVGLRLRPHECASEGSLACWREFAYDECVGWFVSRAGGSEVDLRLDELSSSRRELLTKGVRIESIQVGDPAVILRCF